MTGTSGVPRAAEWIAKNGQIAAVGVSYGAGKVEQRAAVNPSIWVMCSDFCMRLGGPSRTCGTVVTVVVLESGVT